MLHKHLGLARLDLDNLAPAFSAVYAFSKGSVVALSVKAEVGVDRYSVLTLPSYISMAGSLSANLPDTQQAPLPPFLHFGISRPFAAPPHLVGMLVDSPCSPAVAAKQNCHFTARCKEGGDFG